MNQSEKQSQFSQTSNKAMKNTQISREIEKMRNEFREILIKKYQNKIKKNPILQKKIEDQIDQFFEEKKANHKQLNLEQLHQLKFGIQGQLEANQNILPSISSVPNKMNKLDKLDKLENLNQSQQLIIKKFPQNKKLRSVSDNKQLKQEQQNDQKPNENPFLEGKKISNNNNPFKLINPKQYQQANSTMRENTTKKPFFQEKQLNQVSPKPADDTLPNLHISNQYKQQQQNDSQGGFQTTYLKSQQYNSQANNNRNDNKSFELSQTISENIFKKRKKGLSTFQSREEVKNELNKMFQQDLARIKEMSLEEKDRNAQLYKQYAEDWKKNLSQKVEFFQKQKQEKQFNRSMMDKMIIEEEEQEKQQIYQQKQHYKDNGRQLANELMNKYRIQQENILKLRKEGKDEFIRHQNQMLSDLKEQKQQEHEKKMQVNTIFTTQLNEWKNKVQNDQQQMVLEDLNVYSEYLNNMDTISSREKYYRFQRGKRQNRKLKLTFNEPHPEKIQETIQIITN